MDAQTRRVCDDVGRDLASLSACEWPADHVDFVLRHAADRLDRERERLVTAAAKSRAAARQVAADDPLIVPAAEVGVLDRAG